jgi:ribosomal protein S6--L-glutamate ligase
MILSFHTCYVADVNRICQGRDPGPDDVLAMKAADAIIVPQGCRKILYQTARRYCPNVFPDYDVRFRFEGKTGQTKLFHERNVLHPPSLAFKNVEEYTRAGFKPSAFPLRFPLVLKFDWGGEGETVTRIHDWAELENMIGRAFVLEKQGHSGFLLQEFIPSGNKTLRVTVIGDRIISYWRIGMDENGFLSNVSRGATIDHNYRADLQKKGQKAVTSFCRKTGINLAGFDLIFPASYNHPSPFFLEINWFFGRKGLGGSETYYKILTGEIERWLAKIKREKCPIFSDRTKRI